jgi:predicted nucleic acid-binding protein
VIYLDSCALLKLVHPEAETEALRRFLKNRIRTPKVSSAIARAELVRAVRRANCDAAGKVRKASLLDAELDQSRQLIATLRLIDVSKPVLVDAGMVAGPLLRTLDALHLVAATRLGAGLSVLVTYDKRLAAAAEDTGLPVTAPA